MLLLLFLLMLLLGLVTAAPVATVAQPPVPAPVSEPASGAYNAATLTIQNFACPVEYGGVSHAQDCDAPVANLEFALTAPVTLTGTTDAAGVVAFTNLPPGTYELTGGPPGEFVDNAIACHDTDALAIAVPIRPRDNRAIAVTLADTDVTCRWYSIPLDLRGDG
jgi:hypothetical protein